jgi:CO/xanthine dehydrogenase FAD-binding subunit
MGVKHGGDSMTFVIAATVDEATAALAAGAVAVAGGTDLVVGARQGKKPLPGDLVAIDRIAALGHVATSGGLSIGALVTHATLMSHPAIVDHATALADAAALVGSPSTRNVGTLGGNIMNASPAMDTGAPLMVLGASVKLAATRGQRTTPVDEFWSGPGLTMAAPDELCLGVDIGLRQGRSGSAYVRLEYRRAMEIAVVGAAAAVSLANDGTVSAIRVALTAVAPTIIDVPGLAEAVGASPETAAAVATEAARQVATPISDLRAGDAYRMHCIGVMAARAVDCAARRALGETIGVPVNRSLGIGAA